MHDLNRVCRRKARHPGSKDVDVHEVEEKIKKLIDTHNQGNGTCLPTLNPR